MEKFEFEYLGPYHIEGVLGRGGMGTVYKGRHAKSGEPVAIKVIATGVSNQMRFRRRFAAEVETLKRLRHPNIVQLIGYGEEQGLLFYSMEYVDGHSLHDHLRQFRKLDWAEVIQVGIEVTSALKHAHDLGIIHRDLKPANLMLSRDSHIKLTDFGIAKLFGSTEMTAVGSVIGTADFMPPEQAEGKNVTTRSDLYSLGSVLYALISGRAPFGGKSVPEVLYAVRYTPPPDSTPFAPDAPTELHVLIAELLQKDPLKRPPTALVVGNRLKAMQQGLLKLESERARSANSSARADLASPLVGKELTSIDLNDDQDEDLRVTAQPGGNSAQPDLTAHSDLGPRAEGNGQPDSSISPQVNSEPGTQDRPTVIASESAIARLVAARPVQPQGTSQHNPDDPSAISVELAGTVDSRPPETDLPSTDQPLPSSVSHFTPVSDADAKRFTLGRDEDEQQPGFDWLHYGSIAGIVVLLLSAIGVGVWLSQPDTADTMYSEILAAVESEDESALINSLTTLEEFAALYPEDPRAADVRTWIDEAELQRASRSLQRRSTNGGARQLSAIEQGFLACMQARNRSSQEARLKLNAFLAIYGPLEQLEPKERRYVELAEFAAKRLGEVKPDTVPVATLELEKLIRSAEQSLPQEKLPDFYKSVIELYGDKPWAQDQVARIRDKLVS